MTEYFTALILSFVVPGHGPMSTVLVYPSHAACSAAMPVVYETIRVEYRDSGARCVDTGVMSRSLRPRARGE